MKKATKKEIREAIQEQVLRNGYEADRSNKGFAKAWLRLIEEKQAQGLAAGVIASLMEIGQSGNRSAFDQASGLRESAPAGDFAELAGALGLDQDEEKE